MIFDLFEDLDMYSLMAKVIFKSQKNSICPFERQTFEMRQTVKMDCANKVTKISAKVVKNITETIIKDSNTDRVV